MINFISIAIFRQFWLRIIKRNIIYKTKQKLILQLYKTITGINIIQTKIARKKNKLNETKTKILAMVTINIIISYGGYIQTKISRHVLKRSLTLFNKYILNTVSFPFLSL